MKNLRMNILGFFTLLLLASCVGTVDDKDAQSAVNQSIGDISKAISFEGLSKVIPISQDKIELYFFPADGDKTSLVYEIYINNGPIPIKVTGNSLSINSSGLYIFTVAGLSMNSTYTFNMRAVKAGTNEPLKLDPTLSLSATTFNNETADFLGISSLTLGAGESGRDTLKVKWVPATINGTNINPRSTDPVAYEITYVKQSVGAQNINNPAYSGTDRSIITIPYPVSDPPALNKMSEYQMTGLTPGETYFFQVRAIHKGFITYQTDPAYLREQNTRFLKVTMLNNAGLFDFNDALVAMTNPMGEAGLTNLNVSWIPAGGEFKQYRLCFKKVGNPSDVTPIGDYLLDADIDAMLTVTTACLPLDANLTNHTLPSLTSYAYYQAKIIACRTFACEANNRIKSILMQKRVTANIAPFNGVLTITNPVDETKLKDVKVTFDSPVISAGYLNNFKLYCYNSASDTNPIALPTDGTLSSATGKPSCDGIQLLTTMPTALADYGLLTNLEVRLPVIDGSARYCLSLLPSISSPFLNQEDKTTAVIKCFTPEIKTPSIVQFPGRINSCPITGKDLTVNWPMPTGGLFTKYVVMYREKQSSSNFFTFQDATAAYLAGNSTVYKWVDGISKTTLTHVLTNLIEGRTYNIGVLAYLEDGAFKKFSQYNVNIGECNLPLPSPKFNEWVDIFAIGPKEDGLTPATNTGAKTFIPETLDNDGIPVDIKTLAADVKAPDLVNDPLAPSRLSSTQFNGVYGSYNALDTNPLYQYSNSGIVRLSWKDVTFYSETATMNGFITNPSYEASPGTKALRKFGYKVYRSEDNQLTWVDLTKNSSINKFQTTDNAGLVHPSSVTWRARPNSTPITENIISFTDYSVKFSGNLDEVDRARIYYYKIIPVFDGKELAFNSTDNPTHHILKVTLPPRNMALVHRMVANRTICLEMNKDINKTAGDHYSCEFNGLGSTGLTKPISQGSTVYDLGGDLLIDRFELSCPFTRGDVNFSNSNSSFNSDNMDFKGLSTFGDPLKGCYHSNPSSARYEPGTGSAVPTVNYIYKQTIPGDCFGNEVAAISSPQVCADPTRVYNQGYFYPGVTGINTIADCAQVSKTGDAIFDYLNPTAPINTNNSYFPLQSEFAAVYYSRGGYKYNDPSAINAGTLKGGSGKEISNSHRDNNGSCSVNINYLNNTGEYRPRWISVNGLFDKLRTTGFPAGLNLYNKKISEILSNGELYDSTNIVAPTGSLIASNRHKPTSTLARVVTSNSAKLPPLEGMAPKDANSLCSTYKVQVGLETLSKGYVPQNSKIFSKRLMRKKESTIASAWPQVYNNTKVLQIEGGNFIESAIEKGCNVATKNLPDGTTQFVKGGNLTTNFPHAAELHPTLMVGSSSRDNNGNNANTEKCVSKFGVQDMVGNLKEFNSDQIFCDYTEDKLYLGLGATIQQSVLMPDLTPNYDPTQLVAWVLSTPESGSCSIVQAGADRSPAYVNGQGIMESIYNYLGNLVAAFVPQAKTYDQNSVLTARNGDGSFLDFGQSNIAPKLSLKNTISMKDEDLADGVTPVVMPKYFNPALGIPLLCEAGCDGSAADNTTISSDQICASKDCTAMTPAPAITNFPTNNARFTNLGTGDIQTVFTTSTLDEFALPLVYVSQVNVQSNPALNDVDYTTVSSVTASPGNVIKTAFTVPRDQNLKIQTGGSYKELAGRYSMDIAGSSIESERSTQFFTGTRCSILINEDE